MFLNFILWTLMECLHLLQQVEHGVWKMHVLCKVEKNIIFQNLTLLIMFHRQNKTFWYQLCNFKNFLKAENSEDSLASSCEEFCIDFHVTQYETGLLLELVSSSPSSARQFLSWHVKESRTKNKQTNKQTKYTKLPCPARINQLFLNSSKFEK